MEPIIPQTAIETQAIDITEIPFNRLLGIKKASPESGFVVELDESPCFQNHLGTVHAGVQLAIGEVSSGECLLRAFPNIGFSVLAVVRRLEAKFRNPMKGKLTTKASIKKEEAEKLTRLLETKGRGPITVDVEVLDGGGAVGAVLTVEWFIQKRKGETS